MKLRTKCTLTIVGLLIIEILPVPFTSVYSLYAIRKRPSWIPRVTHKLYNETQTGQPKILQAFTPNHDPMLVRKNCTIGLSIMFIVDLLIPVVIPTALYVVLRQPKWFKNLVNRLYSDQLNHLTQVEEETETRHHNPLTLAQIEQKLAHLEYKNFHFVKAQTRKKPSLSNSAKYPTGLR
jgi:hypothetical protein